MALLWSCLLQSPMFTVFANWHYFYATNFNGIWSVLQNEVFERYHTIFIGNEMTMTLTMIRQPFKFPIRLHDLLKQNLTTTAKYTDKKQTQTLWVKNTKNILTIKLKHVIHRDNEKRWQNSKTMNKLIFVFSYLLYLRYVSTEQLCFLYVGNCLQTNCLCRIRKRWKNL